MRVRVQPATVIATVALFVALGGTSFAVVQGTINGSQLRNRSVGGIKLKLHTVNAKDLNLAGLPEVPHARLADHATSAVTAGTAQRALRADSAAALTGKLSVTQISGKLPATQVSGKLPASQISGNLPATQVSGKLPASQISGNLPASQVSGAVANANSAASVTGHTFAQINARGANLSPAPLLSGFGSLTLQCIGPASAPGNVTLRITNSSTNAGTFNAGIVNGPSAYLDQGQAPGAVAGTPTTTDFTFPVTGSAAQVSFAYKIVVGSTTDIVTGVFGVVIGNGSCTAFGNAEAS
jgi:hypothetical protein